VAIEIFRSSELAVRSVCDFGSKTCVVTFDGYTDIRTLDRPGFGEGFFQSHQIDAIHILSRENDWYQYPELPSAARTVAELVKRYDRVVAYGSSMGAYAAIRFGGLAGASVALAISPQFSIDPRVARFERRWKLDRADRLPARAPATGALRRNRLCGLRSKRHRRSPRQDVPAPHAGDRRAAGGRRASGDRVARLA